MMTATPIIVTGMPRAGSSIIAAALADAGVVMPASCGPDGSRIASPGRDILTFHAHEVGERRLALCRPPPPVPLVPTPDLIARAAEAVSGEVPGLPWGWCDPATLLFADVWRHALPQARWIFVYRDPACHAWSLLAGRTLVRHAATPIGQVRLALRLWRHYQTLIRTLHGRFGQSSAIVELPRCFEAGGMGSLSGILQRWDVAVPPNDFAEPFMPHRLRKRAPRWVSLVARLDRGAQLLLADLRRDAIPHAGADTSPAGSRAPAEDRRPRIGIISPLLFVPSETFIEAHRRRLPARVRLVHGRAFPAFVEDGLPLFRPHERFIQAFRSEFGFDLRATRTRALARFFKREGLDALLVEFGNTGARVHEAARVAGIPLIVHFHGYDAYRRDELNEFREDYAEMFESAAALVAVSRDMVRQLVSLGAPLEKIHYNPCGVDVDRFSAADPAAVPARFLSLGRFVEKKGPLLTLLAFREVLQQVPDARLVMAGGGPLRSVAMTTATALGLADRVTFPGTVRHTQVRRFFQASRAFVQHSVRAGDEDSEGTPVAILEAGASGVPVVATMHAGIRDVVLDGETGYLVQEGDVAAMAARMIALAAQPELAAILGRRARQHVASNYSMEKSLVSLWAVIAAAISDAGRREASVVHRDPVNLSEQARRDEAFVEPAGKH